MYRFAVVGGDLRQWYLADILAAKGHNVLTYNLCRDEQIQNVEQASSVKEIAREADVFVYPIPFLGQHQMLGAEIAERKELFSYLRKGQIFFAGCIPKPIVQKLKMQGVQVFDLMDEKSLSVQNSVAAAEGMVAEAMMRTSKNLRGSRCLVLGYGVCGRTLSSYLSGIRCEIRVLEKSPEACCRAKADGMCVLEESELLQELEQADVIFNTIPARILSAKRLSHVRKDVCILDIASGAGGVDYTAARKMGVRAEKLPGLPGKYAPQTSAKIIADTIFQKLKESVT